MRQEIFDIVKKHLEALENINFYSWLGRMLDEDEFPAVIVSDSQNVYDDDSVHTLNIEISLFAKSTISDECAKELRALMKKVSEAMLNAKNEMGFPIKLKKTNLETESSEFSFITGRMLFQISYPDDECGI